MSSITSVEALEHVIIMLEKEEMRCKSFELVKTELANRFLFDTEGYACLLQEMLEKRNQICFQEAFGYWKYHQKEVDNQQLIIMIHHHLLGHCFFSESIELALLQICETMKTSTSSQEYSNVPLNELESIFSQSVCLSNDKEKKHVQQSSKSDKKKKQEEEKRKAKQLCRYEMAGYCRSFNVRFHKQCHKNHVHTKLSAVGAYTLHPVNPALFDSISHSFVANMPGV